MAVPSGASTSLCLSSTCVIGDGRVGSRVLSTRERRKDVGLAPKACRFRVEVGWRYV